MIYEVSVLKSEQGLVLASCPELGLTCVGDSEAEAVDELQTLIFFHTVVMPGEAAEPAGPAPGEVGVAKDTVLYVPPTGRQN